MSEPFVIKSVRDAARLQFSADISPRLEVHDDATYTVKLEGGSVNASVNVYDMQLQRWEEFFRDLAANWRGWSGSKTCESLERHLLLVATSDRIGHIHLRVRLQGLDRDWLAEDTLAGQLDTLARCAAAYFGTPSDRWGRPNCDVCRSKLRATSPGVRPVE